MAENKNLFFKKAVKDIKTTAKIYEYPCGVYDIICSTDFDFCEPGWESSEKSSNKEKNTARKSKNAEQEDLERSMRRARGKLRRLALSNDFKYFVTLTINPDKVDSHSGEDVVKKLNSWCSNMVQRHKLKYILVPERHKKGGIHFHGFFNDVLEVVDSGHVDRQGHKIYNLPQWTLGFTTAIELYGDYLKAVGYVCKYIGKQGEKPAGRWYYSGGGLSEPKCSYLNLNYREVVENYGENVYTLQVAGKSLVIVNNVPKQVQKEE